LETPKPQGYHERESTLRKRLSTLFGWVLVLVAISCTASICTGALFVQEGLRFRLLEWPVVRPQQPAIAPLSVDSPVCGTWYVLENPDLGPGVATSGGTGALTAIPEGNVWLMASTMTCFSSPFDSHYCLNPQPLVLRWDGSSLRPEGAITLDNGKNARLHSGVAIRPDDVWAAGEYVEEGYDGHYYGTDPLLLHWDGFSWKLVETPGLNWDEQPQEMAAIDGDNVWAIGTKSAIRWDGSEWEKVSFPSVTAEGRVYHFRPSNITAVAPSAVWVVGEYWNDTNSHSLKLAALRWDNRAWRSMTIPNACTGTNILTASSASGSNNVWAVGMCADDFAGSSSSPSVSTSVYRPFTARWDGGEDWKVVPSPALAEAASLTGVATTSPADVWAVGRYYDNSPLVAHWDGAHWGVVRSPTDGYVYHVRAVSAGDIWVAGEKGPMMLARFVRSECK
jgi:hypothetical protein